MIPARMAFKEKYQDEVRVSREQNKPVIWSMSQGHDIDGRIAALEKAINGGYITEEKAVAMLPEYSQHTDKFLLGKEGEKGDGLDKKRLEKIFTKFTNKENSNE